MSNDTLGKLNLHFISLSVCLSHSCSATGRFNGGHTTGATDESISKR